MLLLPLAAFFLSGAAGLIYQVTWIRRASLTFGSTTFAVSTVVAAFFLGLALGSWYFGRLSLRASRPLRMVAAMETALAGWGAASPWLFDGADTAYGVCYRALADDAGGGPALFGIRVLLVALLVVPASTLMGGTLPLFCRRYVGRDDWLGRVVGWLYALNTLGAAVGCMAAGYVLLPELGLAATVGVAAVANLLTAVALSRLAPASQTLPLAAPAPSPEQARLLPALLFGVGFVALGGEVLWSRYLALLVPNTIHTYTLALTMVLVGIVLGSAAAGPVSDRCVRPGRVLAVVQALAGLSALAVSLLPPAIWHVLGGDLATCSLLFLPPSVLSGASLPLAIRLASRSAGGAGQVVGRLVGVNTVGGIAGSLVVGYCLPAVGMAVLFRALTGLSIGLAAAAWWRWTSGGLQRVLVPGLAATTWLLLPAVFDTRLPADFLAPAGQLRGYREGYGANLAAVARDGRLNLEIDRWWQGSDVRSHQIMAAHLPMILHPEPRRVLAVGLGTGLTASRFLLYDEMRSLDCVDIEPTLFEFIAEHFDTGWAADPRVRVLNTDGRNYLQHSAARYDVISLEVGQLTRPGVAFFYTADFYRRARQRLAEGGLLVQFVPLRFLDLPHLRSALATFLQVFPRSYLWFNTCELLLVGARDAELRFGRRSFAVLEADGPVHRDLRYSPWGGPEHWLNHPEVFVGGLLAGPRQLQALAGDAPLLSDDRPLLDYAAQGDADTRALAALERHLTPVREVLAFEPEAEWSERAHQTRRWNLAALRAEVPLGLAKERVSAGQLAVAVPLLDQALQHHPRYLEALRLRGDVLVRLGRFDEARRAFAAALSVDESDPAALYGMGLSLHQLGQPQQALGYYRAALKGRPLHSETHHNLAAALVSTGRTAEALPHLEEAVRLRPDDEGARRDLSMLRAALATR